MKTETIHVFLPKEDVAVWAPVDAEHLYEDVYRIIDCRGEDEEVEFWKSTMVRCKMRRLSGHFGKMGDVLVAYEAVNSN
jgi:hypothetical protein